MKFFKKVAFFTMHQFIKLAANGYEKLQYMYVLLLKKSSLFRRFNFRFQYHIYSTKVFKNTHHLIASRDISGGSAKCGIIITYHNHASDFVIPCIDSILLHTPLPRYILVFDNQSTEKDAISLPSLYSDKDITFIRIDDQNKNGGLTGTWNQGIDRCIQEGCEKIILLNHDTLVDETWPIFIQSIQNNACVYGPVSNRPSVEGFCIFQKRTKRYAALHRNKVRLVSFVNGFCFGCTRHCFEKNKYDEHHYFDPHKPFGGNEMEWMNRFAAIQGQAVIVEGAYVFHHKDHAWKK